MANKRLLLVDGNSILFRAYFGSAYPGATILRSSQGVATNAVLTFNRILLNVLTSYEPTHVLIAFDAGRETHRHAVLESYKAGRAATPDDLKAQFPLAREMLTLMGLQVYEKALFEADDIIATAAKTFASDETMIFSSDRDLLQLVDDKTKLLLPQNFGKEPLLIATDNFEAKYGVKPTQVPDLKGLVGDASDNLPGVKGIGPKSATQLLTTYQTFENIYQHLPELSPGLQQKLTAGHAEGVMSKQMALLSANVTLPFTFEDLAWSLQVSDELLAFFDRYELKSLRQKYQGLVLPEELDKISF